MGTAQPEPVLRALRAGVAPLSFAQERLWLIDAAAPGSPTYNVPLLLRWRGPVDPGALGAAVRALVARHEILRTTYRPEDGVPFQVVGREAPVAVEVIDVAGTPDAWERAVAGATARGREPFDLATGPVLRCAAWRGIPGGDAVLLAIHHIAVDGWSLPTLLGDLAAAYAGPASLPEPALQYADYAAWDRATFAAPEAQRRLAARVAQLLDVPRGLTLAARPPGGPARPEAARPGVEDVLPVPGSTWASVHELARALRLTPFVVLFAAFQVVLQRWSGQDEFLVGAVMANRPRAELTDMVGFFVNTVPLRCRLRPDWSFADLCTRTRTEAFHALTYQRLPFDQLTARAAGARRDGHGAMVDVGFALQTTPAPAAAAHAPCEAPRVLHTGTAKFDLVLVVDERPDGPVVSVESDTGRYPAGIGRRVGESFLVLLAAAAADPGTPLWRLPVTEGGAAGVLDGGRRDLVAERLERIGSAAR